jgi:hypothetical protein
MAGIRVVRTEVDLTGLELNPVEVTMVKVMNQPELLDQVSVLYDRPCKRKRSAIDRMTS